MRYTNWSNYFTSRADNEKGNQNTTVYSDAWAQNKSRASKLTLLTNDPDTVILAADAEGTIIPLHSFANLGGTLLRPNDKFVCLIGSGQMGIAVIVSENSATADCNFPAPTPDIIIAKKTATELQAIPDPGTNNPASGGDQYSGSATFLPAPWLVDTILGSKSNDPWELILLANPNTNL